MASIADDSNFQLFKSKYEQIADEFGKDSPEAVAALQNLLLLAETHEQCYYIYENAPNNQIRVIAFEQFGNKIRPIIELGQEQMIPTMQFAYVLMIANAIKSATTIDDVIRITEIVHQGPSLPLYFKENIVAILKKYQEENTDPIT